MAPGLIFLASQGACQSAFLSKPEQSDARFAGRARAEDQPAAGAARSFVPVHRADRLPTANEAEHLRIGTTSRAMLTITRTSR
jgi:hypothetical protein